MRLRDPSLRSRRSFKMPSPKLWIPTAITAAAVSPFALALATNETPATNAEATCGAANDRAVVAVTGINENEAEYGSTSNYALELGGHTIAPQEIATDAAHLPGNWRTAADIGPDNAVTLTGRLSEQDWLFDDEAKFTLVVPLNGLGRGSVANAATSDEGMTISAKVVRCGESWNLPDGPGAVHEQLMEDVRVLGNKYDSDQRAPDDMQNKLDTTLYDVTSIAPQIRQFVADNMGQHPVECRELVNTYNQTVLSISGHLYRGNSKEKHFLSDAPKLLIPLP